MDFNPDNIFLAQILRNRFDTLTNARISQADSDLNHRSTSLLSKYYPPYSAFRASHELTREKVALDRVDELGAKEVNEKEENPINMIRLQQTADILKAVLDECEEEKNKINTNNDELRKFL